MDRWTVTRSRHRARVVLVLVSLTAWLGTAAALAGSGTHRVEIVRGRVFDAETSYTDGRTAFQELLVENAVPGSTVRLSRSAPCTAVSAHRRISQSRIVDLESLARRMPLQPGCSLAVRLGNPDGRTKTLIYTARRGLAPTRTRICTAASGHVAACTQACPPAGHAPSDVCAGSDQTVVAVPLAVRYVRVAGGGIRVTRIGVAFEAGSVISLHCSGASCPFFAKAGYAPSSGSTNLAPYLHGRVLEPGTTLELWVEHENNVGRVFRAVIRRRGIATAALCISQVDLHPRACS